MITSSLLSLEEKKTRKLARSLKGDNYQSVNQRKPFCALKGPFFNWPPQRHTDSAGKHIIYKIRVHYKHLVIFFFSPRRGGGGGGEKEKEKRLERNGKRGIVIAASKTSCLRYDS